MKKRVLFLAIILVLALAVGCGGNGENSSATDPDDGNKEDSGVDTNEYPVATITMADGGIITLELYPDIAPESVKNFIYLANSGFYDGLIFHRVIENFMIQGGCPDGTGYSGPGYTIAGEFSLNGVQNDISHERGVISMARSQAYDSAGSQFFICHADSPHLDGSYAAFGRVTSGLAVVDRIATVDTDSSDRPTTDQVIESIRVETFGVEYGEPEKLD
ncbi:MAG: peptidylprolyl isomerase [Clostridia bacterium]|nr:peptidylprolyl isomerase [Clostridia bacterium]